MNRTPYLISSNVSIFLLLCICLLTFIPSMTVAAVPEAISLQVTDLQDAAEQLVEEGNYSAAIEKYQQIIQSYPNTSYGFDACTKSANLYIEQKQYENLQPVVVQICTNFKDQPWVFGTFSDLVTDCMYAKAYSAAESICTEVQTQLPSHPRVTLAIGWRGMVYAHQGNFDGADQMRQTLLQKKDCIASDFLGGMDKIGWGYYCAGEWDEALKTYRLALERDSTHPSAVHLQYQIVKTYLTQGDFTTVDTEMEALLTKYAHRTNTPGLACRLAKDYRREKQFERAIALYGTLLERFPDDGQTPSIRDAIVETYADMGDLTKAQEALQIDIEKCPHRRELLRMITRVAVETARIGDPNTATAMKLVEAIFSQNPEGADQQLFGYTTQARVYVYQGKDAEAAATVDEALELFKEHPNALAYHLFGVGEEYYLCAKKALQNSDEETAKEEFLKAISLWEKIYPLADQKYQAQTVYFSGMSYQLMKEYRKAIQYYTKIDAEFPESKDRKLSLFMVAECYETMKHQHQISISQARREVRKVYTKLAEDYPDSPKAEIARIWLERNTAVQ